MCHYLIYNYFDFSPQKFTRVRSSIPQKFFRKYDIDTYKQNVTFYYKCREVRIEWLKYRVLHLFGNYIYTPACMTSIHFELFFDDRTNSSFPNKRSSWRYYKIQITLTCRILLRHACVCLQLLNMVTFPFDTRIVFWQLT